MSELITFLTGGGGGMTARQNGEATNSVIAAPTAIPGLAFPLLAGHRYWFEFMLSYQSSALTTGAGFTTTGPAYSSSHWWGNIRSGATGADMMWQQENNTLGTLVAASVPAINTPYLAVLEGFCTPTVDGTLQLRLRTEVEGSVITALDGGIGLLIDAGM